MAGAYRHTAFPVQGLLFLKIFYGDFLQFEYRCSVALTKEEVSIEIGE
jgi:hypothetical protein